MHDLKYKVVIDVAVICQELAEIDKMCDDHVINLDEILITKEDFQNIFYPFSENFGINKNSIVANDFYLQLISFLPEFRTTNKKKFYLLEEILTNMESDLNISRNCFTTESRVELSSQILGINSLCDINCCSLLSSLTWSNIMDIIYNYQLINKDKCTNTNDPIIPICVVTVIFKTPTPDVKNTVVRFNYRLTDI